MSNLSVRFFLQDDLIPNGFLYPKEFVDLAKSNELVNLRPWRFLWNDEPEFLFKGLLSRYPSRCLIPFSKRQGSDDIACFDGSNMSGTPVVFIIHDFAAPGWELRGTLKEFTDWIQMAEEDARDWRLEHEDDED